MTDKTDIERRTLLGAITAASGSALSLALLSRRADAQPNGKATSAASDHFEAVEVKTGDNTIFVRRYGALCTGNPPVAPRYTLSLTAWWS